MIPGPLRVFTGGENRVQLLGTPATLRDALDDLWTVWPSVRDRIVTEQGEVREHINLFVGTEDVRYTGGLATPIPPESEITIVPAISGGSTKMELTQLTIRLLTQPNSSSKRYLRLCIGCPGRSASSRLAPSSKRSGESRSFVRR